MTDRLGLLGASVTQHPEFEALLDWLLQPERAHVRLSIASVRTNTVTPALAGALARSGTRSLTVAVESGSDRVRAIVNKKLSSEEIVRCVEAAQVRGMEGLRLSGGSQALCWTSVACARDCHSHRWARPTSRLPAPPRSPALQEGGLEGLKLYGMVGVPGEEEEGEPR